MRLSDVIQAQKDVFPNATCSLSYVDLIFESFVLCLTWSPSESRGTRKEWCGGRGRMKGGRTVEHKTNERNKGEYWEEKGLSRG